MKNAALAAASLILLSGSATAFAEEKVDFSRYMRHPSSLSAIATALSILDCRVPVEFEEKASGETPAVELTAFCPEVDNEAGATVKFLVVDEFLIPEGFSFFP